MKFYESGAALAEDVGLLVSKMQDSIEANYQASSRPRAVPRVSEW